MKNVFLSPLVLLLWLGGPVLAQSRKVAPAVLVPAQRPTNKSAPASNKPRPASSAAVRSAATAVTRPDPVSVPAPAPEPASPAFTPKQLDTEARSVGKSLVFKVNVLSPIVSTASVFLEKTLSETTSAQLGFYYTGASLADVRLRGFGITPEYRFYLSKSSEAPDGAYVAPFGRFQSLTLSDADNSGVRFTSFGGGVLLGRQWLLGQQDNIVLDLFGGPAYNVAAATVDEVTVPGVVTGFGFRFGLAFGFAF